MRRRNARLALFVFTSLVVLSTGALLVGKVLSLHRNGVLGITYQEPVDSEAADRLRNSPLEALLRPGQILMLAEQGPAGRAGIRVGDQIISFNGIPIVDAARVRALSERVGPGDPVLVRWQPFGGGEAREATLRLESPISNPGLFLHPAITFLVGIAYFLTGALVLRARKEERSALVFHTFAAMGAGFFLIGALAELQIRTQRGILPMNVAGDLASVLIFSVYSLFAFGLIATLVHLALVFPRAHPLVERYPRLIVCIYVTPLALFLAMVVGLGLLKSRGGAPWTGLLALSLLLGCAGLLALVFRRGGGAGVRALLASPLLSMSGAFLGALSLLQLLRFGPQFLYPLAVLLLFGLGTVGISLFFPVLALVLFVNSYRRAGVEEKRQFRWPLFGLIAALGGMVLLGVAGTVLGFSIAMAAAGPEVLALQYTISGLNKLMYLIIPVSFAFGILKYRLMDVDVVIRKTLIYSIVSAIVLVTYLLLVGGIGTILVRTTHSRSDVVVIGSTLLVAMIFVPLRNRVQGLVDRTFFRNRASLPLVLRELGTELSTTDDVATILTMVSGKLQKGLQLGHVRIVSGNVAATVFAGGQESSSARADFKGVFEDRAFTMARQPSAPAELPMGEDMRPLMAQHGIERIVAPAADRGVVAVILAGPKLSGERWESEDDEFLVSVAERMALSIETARLRHEEEEFRQAQQIQRSLLPRELPQIEGLTVSGFWQPARAVGGDYYDCLRFDEHQMAVCIGDVVGKGMPAALLMSSLQAGVRAIADAETPPSTVLDRVRRVVENTLDRGKFITFFYGILDRQAGQFRYSNAGHNPPVLVRSGGEIELLESGGPAFARLFREQPFSVATTPLRPGDRIVLFTDGLTEAEDAEGNPLGDDLLVKLIVEARQLPARELQEALLTAVLRYSNGNLHDDLTLLVIEVS